MITSHFYVQLHLYLYKYKTFLLKAKYESNLKLWLMTCETLNYCKYLTQQAFHSKKGKKNTEQVLLFPSLFTVLSSSMTAISIHSFNKAEGQEGKNPAAPAVQENRKHYPERCPWCWFWNCRSHSKSLSPVITSRKKNLKSMLFALSTWSGMH